ncbi:MAG: phosphate transport system substrate-binding protein [Solirubrobacterales bacterium]|jgi:phosphate transport system substrate-binding protein|nr:phosphate transport system substrate-binding protein [Solirubrobacterales bacterium]
MRIKTIAVTALALMGLAVPASAGAKTLIGSGSVAAQPVLQALFATYSKQVNKKIHFVYTANGGNAGVKDVQNGTSQFAGQARTPLPSDAGTTYIKLYLDGLCIDVNPRNKLSNISIQQTHDIYRGLLTNWGQLPGSGLTTTIDPYGRDTNGGTYNFFLQAVLNNEPPASNVNALTADGLVVNAVKQDPNAIGYDGLAWQGKGQKALRVNGVPCVSKKISVEPLKYPLSRYIFIVLPTANPSPAVQKFVDWARRSALAGEVISRAGGVPAFNKKS